MAKELPYFKFYSSEWSDGNISLESWEAQGLFVNLCCWYWSRECKLELELVNKKYRLDLELISQLFDANVIKEKNGFLIISFLDQQMKERKARSKQNRINGLGGGRPKTQSVNSRLAKQNPVVTNKEEKRREEKKEENIKEKFDEWWAFYPRKLNKKKAETSYKTAIKKASSEELLEALKSQLCTFSPDLEFVPHATTWLNGERWANPVEAVKQDYSHKPKPGEVYL